MRRMAVVASGLLGLALLLASLSAWTGLTTAGWVVGAGCGLVPSLAVALGGHRADRSRSGESAAESPTPADLVTLTRAVLACGVAALVADSLTASPAAHAPVLVGLAASALLLDAVDGQVARRTGTVSGFGARFDGETDAFLILVLSLYAVPRYGAWVLTLGVVRYAFWLGGRAAPWLSVSLPARYWRKVVAASVGVVLTVAAADIVPHRVVLGLLVVAALLLAESFGRDVLWLWRRRHEVPQRAGGSDRPAGPARRMERLAVDLFALLVVWAVLLAPTELPALAPSVLLRIPVEALVVGALALALPTRPRRAVAAVLGVLFALAMIVKLLDMGFFAALDRPFNPVTDLGLFGPVFALVRDTVGRVAGDVVGVAALLTVIVLLVGVPLAVRRISSVVARHRRRSAPVVAVLTVLWVVAAFAGWQVRPGAPVAAASSVQVASAQVQLAVTTVRGEQRFAAALTRDRFRDVSADRLLTGLRGKDVVVAIVESYGRVALDGSKGSASSGVRALLRRGTRQLQTAGYTSRSAFLASPTFGGHSWLAHSTLQSGLWVSDEGRYHRLLASDRMTLSRSFHRAGWRTVAVQPSDSEPWPEGKAFYHFDQIYDGPQLGYHGPRFGFSLMPDQFALEALQRQVLAPARRPVFAQIELASSHTPWAPLPRLVDWDRLGDGTVFGPIHHRAQGIAQLWDNKALVPRAYAQSIRYTLTSLIQFVQRYGDDDLVLVLLGDHQPASIVSGYHASHQVPITIIASDPEVLRQVDGWHWQRGLLPGKDAPVWPMDAFRDRFLQAYDSPSGSR